MTIQPSGSGRHLFLYDGVCGLCNRVNRFVLRYDSRGDFDFAPLQSATGRAFLMRRGETAGELNTFYIVRGYRSTYPAILSKARAVLFVAETLGWPWRLLTVFSVLPMRLLDFVYDLVARCRYAVFGRYESCPLPPVEHRKRFIDG